MSVVAVVADGDSPDLFYRDPAVRQGPGGVWLGDADWWRGNIYSTTWDIGEAQAGVLVNLRQITTKAQLAALMTAFRARIFRDVEWLLGRNGGLGGHKGMESGPASAGTNGTPQRMSPAIPGRRVVGPFEANSDQVDERNALFVWQLGWSGQNVIYSRRPGPRIGQERAAFLYNLDRLPTRAWRDQSFGPGNFPDMYTDQASWVPLNNGTSRALLPQFQTLTDGVEQALAGELA